MSSVASLDAEVEEWRRFNSEFLTIFRKLGEELYHFGKLNVLVIHGVPGTADCPRLPGKSGHSGWREVEQPRKGYVLKCFCRFHVTVLRNLVLHFVGSTSPNAKI